ncbi:MAG: MBL fold metallo-hydrolase [Acidobacteria bacterium]|nr:MBL fold metallo-hydrolase [Acidobacteriota bacterium]
MIFEQIETGGDRNFGYLIGDSDTGVAALVDPSPDPKPCLAALERHGLSLEMVINTHSHSDHTSGNAFLKDKTGCSIVTHASAPHGDIRVDDSHPSLPLGKLILSFLHTPGHTPDSICVHVGDELVTGDTLFVGKIGGTATRKEAETEFQSLLILMEMEPHIRVWPGHNYGIAKSSTIGHEQENNPFILRLNDFSAFYWLKQNWADYKIRHGIK